MDRTQYLNAQRTFQALLSKNIIPIVNENDTVAMKALCSLEDAPELTVDERNLLSVGYKNVIGARRASWRILNSIEDKERGKGHEEQAEKVKEYRARVEGELKDVCTEVLDILDNKLLSNSNNGAESKVFYYKMKGDYYRYLAEVSSTEDREAASKKADEASSHALFGSFAIS